MNPNDFILESVSEEDYPFLYEALKNRPKKAAISHKKMPSYEEHVLFCKSKPYKFWGIIKIHSLYNEMGFREVRPNNIPIGNVYLTRRNEIGIFLLPEYQKKGLGAKAVKALMNICNENFYLANIAPTNDKSRHFFKKMGFELVQHTFRKEM